MQLKDFIPIPNLMDARSVLVVFPHPDDAEIAAGGAVALLADKGAQVTYAVMTTGDLGTYDPRISRGELSQIRRREQDKAAKLLGVKELIFLGFEDGNVPGPETLRRHIVSLIRKVKPDMVITLDPWMPYESHPDHRNTALAAVESCLYATFPHAYPEDMEKGLSPWQVNGVAMALSPYPNTFIGIDTVWERKIQALKCHESQFPEPTWQFFENVLRVKSSEYGSKVGANFGEAFKVLSLTHLHVVPDCWQM